MLMYRRGGDHFTKKLRKCIIKNKTHCKINVFQTANIHCRITGDTISMTTSDNVPLTRHNGDSFKIVIPDQKLW